MGIYTFKNYDPSSAEFDHKVLAEELLQEPQYLIGEWPRRFLSNILRRDSLTEGQWVKLLEIRDKADGQERHKIESTNRGINWPTNTVGKTQIDWSGFLKRNGFPLTQATVLAHMICHSNPQQGCRARVADLAARLNTSESSIYRSTSRAKKVGLIYQVRHNGHDSTYWFNYEWKPAKAGAGRPNKRKLPCSGAQENASEFFRTSAKETSSLREESFKMTDLLNVIGISNINKGQGLKRPADANPNSVEKGEKPKTTKLHVAEGDTVKDSPLNTPVATGNGSKDNLSLLLSSLRAQVPNCTPQIVYLNEPGCTTHNESCAQKTDLKGPTASILREATPDTPGDEIYSTHAPGADTGPMQLPPHLRQRPPEKIYRYDLYAECPGVKWTPRALGMVKTARLTLGIKIQEFIDVINFADQSWKRAQADAFPCRKSPTKEFDPEYALSTRIVKSQKDKLDELSKALLKKNNKCRKLCHIEKLYAAYKRRDKPARFTPQEAELIHILMESGMHPTRAVHLCKDFFAVERALRFGNSVAEALDKRRSVRHKDVPEKFRNLQIACTHVQKLQGIDSEIERIYSEIRHIFGPVKNADQLGFMQKGMVIGLEKELNELRMSKSKYIQDIGVKIVNR